MAAIRAMVLADLAAEHDDGTQHNSNNTTTSILQRLGQHLKKSHKRHDWEFIKIINKDLFL